MIKIGILVAGLYGVSFLFGNKTDLLSFPGDSKTKTERSMKNKNPEHQQVTPGITVV